MGHHGSRYLGNDVPVVQVLMGVVPAHKANGAPPGIVPHIKTDMLASFRRKADL